MTNLTLVTAATAPVGRSIVEQLVAAGAPVRALTRDPQRAGLPAEAEVVTGDLTDPASLATALTGVTSVFLLAMSADVTPFLDAAAAAGVEHVVFQSSASPDAPQPNDIAVFHDGIEAAGPVSLTHREQVALIGQAKGRELRFEELEPAAARTGMSPHAPGDVLFATWERHLTTPAPVTGVFAEVTGLTPRTAQEWAASH